MNLNSLFGKGVAVCAFLLFSNLQPITAQVGIGTNTPDASSALDISSTSSGVLAPRMNTTQRDNISSPATGLLVYNTSTNTFDYNMGTPASPNWVSLGTGGSSSPSSAKFSNTDTTTDLNFPTTSNLQVPIFGNEVWNDDTGLFVLVNDETLRITETGRYRLQYNISIENQSGSNNDSGLRAILRINGTAVNPVSFSSTGIMLSNQDHDQASLHLADVFEFSANDEISIHIFDANNNVNVITLESAGTSTFYIEKIN
ncbi:hypothetical protein GWK08_04525 [Leptobacterium flavescens]|uniref:C1q domain-containing protein n=1 Tax=Leptobacterium flavescens TaxID=472055 RepID=A0A6P0UHH4_9FLAO|nr:hypothetical protein [Leptobacterium flavescens]NER12694.1 hypothetical protein [Leptobacterium flavescens]